METTLSVAVLVLLLLGAVLVVVGTIFKNRFGINFQRLSCPNCGTKMPLVRVPKTGGQAMWGGATCPKCGCQMDKWGRRLTG